MKRIPTQLAVDVAVNEAKSYYDREWQKDKPLAFRYCCYTIAEKIAMELYDNNYTWDYLTYQERMRIAFEALESLEYPNPLQFHFDKTIE